MSAIKAFVSNAVGKLLGRGLRASEPPAGSDRSSEQLHEAISTLVAEKRFLEAIDLCDQLLAQNRLTKFALRQKTRALIRIDKSETALEFVRPLFEKDPNPAVAIDYLTALAKTIASKQNRHLDNHARELNNTFGWLKTHAPEQLKLPASVLKALIRIGSTDGALPYIDQFIATRPDEKVGYLAKLNYYVTQKEFGAAKRMADIVAQEWPDDRYARNRQNVLAHLGADRKKAELQEIIIANTKDGRLALTSPDGAIDMVDDVRMLKRFCARSSWIAFKSSKTLSFSMAAARSAIKRAGHAGCVQTDDAISLWKSEAILRLIESGSINEVATIESALAKVEPFYLPPPRENVGSPANNVLLVSRHGPNLFGGGEHFLRTMAGFYGDRGFRPILVGIRQLVPPDFNPPPEFEFELIEDEPAELRRLILAREAKTIHSITGAGYLSCEAALYSNVRHIHGVHHWSEALGFDRTARFFDSDNQPIKREDFNFVLQNASLIYANSVYTQGVLAGAFDIRFPILFSIPDNQGRQ